MKKYRSVFWVFVAVLLAGGSLSLFSGKNEGLFGIGVVTSLFGLGFTPLFWGLTYNPKLLEKVIGSLIKGGYIARPGVLLAFVGTVTYRLAQYVTSSLPEFHQKLVTLIVTLCVLIVGVYYLGRKKE